MCDWVFEVPNLRRCPAGCQVFYGLWYYGVHHKNLVTWENRAPKDWQVLSLGDVGFLQLFRVVSGDYGRPCNKSPVNSPPLKGTYVYIRNFSKHQQASKSKLLETSRKTMDQMGWVNLPKNQATTLRETNIAHEHPHLSWWDSAVLPTALSLLWLITLFVRLSMSR